ncbi:hypothetical protein [Nocardioides terrisoli]|uniref:hypothetical protein n=1 Tax=Nocardioides terrisoli TaxID=3388267 RepID=UPI00287BA93E|nr:hypothetical protein [Nocardioides marmorisolisilvae]
MHRRPRPCPARPGAVPANAVVVLAGSLVAVAALAGCGGTRSEPTTIKSHQFSCTDQALAQRTALRRLIAGKVDAIIGRPRLTDYCSGGMDAGVELHLRGVTADVADGVAAALHCDQATHARVALGRQTSYRCHVGGMWLEVRLVQYLPPKDPHGPQVLLDAALVAPPG